MDISELKFLNAFNAIPSVGAATLRAIKNHFGSFAAAWNADGRAFENLQIGTAERTALQERKNAIDPDREMQKILRGEIWIITDDEGRYPPRLKEISYPPLILYGRGDEQALAARHSVAVVGTRRPTPYGIEAAETIAGGLTDAGIMIISGLASGIDAKAHAAALDTKGRTIAVLGNGVDHFSIFPPENRGLAQRIIDGGGAIISEYAPGTPAVKEHFPMRNRIISGLSQGVVVVEAREKSGALITARLALDQNREVLAVPGSIFSPTSAGTNKLIQQGAKAVIGADDILEELGIDREVAARENAAQALNHDEAALLDVLAEPASVDTLKAKTRLPVSAIMANLSMLELKNLVRNLGGNVFRKI